MADFYEPTTELKAAWVEFVASRPENVHAVAANFTPWTLYRMKSTGQRVTIYSFGEHEDGPVTLTVNVLGRFNLILFDRQVFGVAPSDLEECDLPSDAEPLGAAMSTHEANNNIDVLRVMVRPDLWEMSEDGTAKRKV